METIVVPLDQSTVAEAALPVAARLAERLGATLSLVTVSSPGIDRVADELYLQHVVDELAVPAEFRLLQSNDPVHETLLTMVRGRPEALVCMSAHGHTGIRLLVGSISEAMVRSSPVPVVLVGPHAGDAIALDRIIVCLDGSALAEGAIGPATSLAQRLGAAVELFHVADRAIDDDIRSTFERFAAPGVEVAVTKEHGLSASHAIADRARRSGAGLVAMATHGRTGLRRALFGSVAQDVVHEAPCPVLLIHPS